MCSEYIYRVHFCIVSDSLLSGKGTEEYVSEKENKRELYLSDIAKKIIGLKKGDEFTTGFLVERINRGADGYPSSITVSGKGIVKGVLTRLTL